MKRLPYLSAVLSVVSTGEVSTTAPPYDLKKLITESATLPIDSVERERI
jgi:hypothetical protein